MNTPLCKLGRPIDNARINKYEMLCHYLIRKHFPSHAFPSLFDYDDVLNQCRLEVFKAIKKLDPKKALDSYLKDPVKRAAKIAEKEANPEKAYQIAEKNLAYWQVDNHLKRMKWNHGIKTAPEKRRGKTYSLEALFQNNSFGFVEDVNFAKISNRLLTKEQQAIVKALFSTLVESERTKGAASAKKLFGKLSKTNQELLLEYIEFRISSEKNDSQLFSPFIQISDQEEAI